MLLTSPRHRVAVPAKALQCCTARHLSWELVTAVQADTRFLLTLPHVALQARIPDNIYRRHLSERRPSGEDAPRKDG